MKQQMKEKVESSLSKAAKDVIKFSFDKSQPITKEDKEMKEDIKKIKKKGRFIHIPND